MPKVWLWSRDFHKEMGGPFAYIDLDVVVLTDLEPLLREPSPIRIWDRAKLELYNTSLFSVVPGYGNEVWDRLCEAEWERAKKAARYWTGDQSWLAHVLGPGLPTFGERDGIICYRPSRHRAGVPSGTRAAFMCGPFEPFSEASQSKWVHRAYR
jgi:hypothetical protein